MGRKTFESLPDKQPLKERINIVLTRNIGFDPEGVEIVHNREILLKTLQNYDTNDVYIIGGEEIYNLFLEECDRAYITKIDSSFSADVHFPNLDIDPNWENIWESETVNDNGFDICFNKYRRI